MKQHEKDAQIAALRKQLAELEAMPVEPEQPLCVMPGRMDRGEVHFWVNAHGRAVQNAERATVGDESCFAVGNYFSSERQAEADAHAVSVMRLMRRMPGVVGGDTCGMKYRPYVHRERVGIQKWSALEYSACMFPCYATEEQARAAIEAVGGEDAIRRCAEYWSGVMK